MHRFAACRFQSLADDPVDQLALLLMGGQFARPGAPCSVWDSHACPCQVPAHLLGNGSTVVELGANDGLHMSNGYFFERQLEWRSVCIEANPDIYADLVANRPGCINVNALVGRTEDFNGSHTARFISFRGGSDASRGRSKAGLSWETGMSAVEGLSVHRHASSLAAAQSWARHISRFRAPLEARTHTLEVRPLSSLLDAHGIREVDFLSLDVEGAEASVLRSIDFGRTKIRLMAIETVDAKAKRMLRQNGFRDVGMRAALGDQFWVHDRHFREKFAPSR